MKASEVLRQYAKGRRDFRGENLRCLSFKGQDKDFSLLNLQGINLQGANLANASFINADFSNANLKNADLNWFPDRSEDSD